MLLFPHNYNFLSKYIYMNDLWFESPTCWIYPQPMPQYQLKKQKKMGILEIKRSIINMQMK